MNATELTRIRRMYESAEYRLRTREGYLHRRISQLSQIGENVERLEKWKIRLVRLETFCQNLRKILLDNGRNV